MSRAILLILSCSFTIAGSGSLYGQNPNGFILSDQWACLVPLSGNDCSGGGPHVMDWNWIAPYDLALENPVAGTVWDDIDFGGSSPSAAWRGSGQPAWVNVGLGAPAEYIDWEAYCVANGLTDDFVMGIGVTYIENTTGAPLPVGVCTASDDSIQVWVNSSKVLTLEACRGATADCAELTPAVLAPGTNRIAVLVWEGFGGFGFRLGLTRPDGSKYTQADPQIRFLGASAPLAGPPPVPVAERIYDGSPFQIPGDSYTITIQGRGFDRKAAYTVIEELHGCAANGMTISNIASGGKVEGIDPPAPSPSIAVLETRVFVGADLGGGSGTTVDDRGTPADPGDDIYTSKSTSGGDLWAGGDDFEFMYTTVTGDFDIAIEFLSKEGGNGRWGKFGLMARESLDRCSRDTFVKDHRSVFVDAGDCAGLEGRDAHLVCDGGLFGTDRFLRIEDLGDELCHPSFLRLTRRGNLIQGWASNQPGLADGTLNPRDDCNWVPARRNDAAGQPWANIPDELLAGFFNSEHNDNGWSLQTIRFRILQDTPAKPFSPAGRRIVWNVTGDLLDDGGVRYQVSGPRLAKTTVTGRAGPAAITGPNQLFFQSPGSGPVGPFDGSVDIGDLGPCTPGSLVQEGNVYKVTGSGLDIWADGDQFHYAHAVASGDFQATAHFTGVSHPPAGGRWGKYGIMARWDMRPNSAYYFTHNAGASDFDCTIDGPRDAFRPHGGYNGGNAEVYQIWWQDVFGDERVAAGCPAPYPYIRSNDLRGDERNMAPWLRMVRRGSTFYSYGSDDGEHWKVLGSYSWPQAPDPILIGIAVTSHANCETETVSFNQFEIVKPAPIVPAVDPKLPLEKIRALPSQLVYENEFELDDGQLPADFIAHKWGGPTYGFFPQVVNERLRMGDIRNSPLGSGEGTGTSAFLKQALDPDGAYLFDFDVKFAYDLAAAGDGNPPADGLTLTVLGSSDQVPRREHTPQAPAGEFKRTTVGTSWGSDNTTTIRNGTYTSVSSTGRDIWVDGDSFEFVYSTVKGDFDVSIELISKRFPAAGRWGKFGLMARQSLAHNSKFGMVQDHGPDLQDPARWAFRPNHREVWKMDEPVFTNLLADPNDGSSLSHPRYLRLTRTGGAITAWISNTAGRRDPAADANWVKLFEDDTWGGVETVFLGFAYSHHNSSGDTSGAINWKPVLWTVNRMPEPPEEAPVFHHLDARFGDIGGSLGYHRINQTQGPGDGVIRSKDLAMNSFAIEFDNWHGSQEENDGEGGNVSGWNPAGGAEGTGTGFYHIGLDVNHSIFTAQRNHQAGVHDYDLPDIYLSDGIHATVLYDHGLVKAWVRSNDGGQEMKVIDYQIEPLSVNSGVAIAGFTSATGGASCTLEVDNFEIRRLAAGPVFRRGDLDSSGVVDISDPINELHSLFLGDFDLTCQDAADFDDSGEVDITDAINSLLWQFGGGPAAPPPGAASCGADPTPDKAGELGCRSYTAACKN